MREGLPPQVAAAGSMPGKSRGVVRMQGIAAGRARLRAAAVGTTSVALYGAGLHAQIMRRTCVGPRGPGRTDVGPRRVVCSSRSCEFVGSDVSAGHRDLAFPRVYLRDLRAFDHGAPPQGDSRIVLRGTLYPTASTEQTPHFSTFCSHLWETDSAADATHIFGARHHRHVVTTPLTDGRLHTAAHRHLSPRPHATPRTAAPRTPLCHFSTHPSTEHPLIAS